MRAFSGDGTFRANLGADADVAALLSPAELDHCFDLAHALRHAGTIATTSTGTPTCGRSSRHAAPWG